MKKYTRTKFIMVYPFFLRELKLKGVECLVFADIYRRCVHCVEKEAVVNNCEIADLIGSTRQAVHKAIQRLKTKRLVKELGRTGIQTRYGLWAVVPDQNNEPVNKDYMSTEFTPECKQSLQSSSTKLTLKCKQSLQTSPTKNNIIYNNHEKRNKKLSGIDIPDGDFSGPDLL